MIYRTNANPASEMSSKFIRRMKAIVRYYKLYRAYKKHYFFLWSEYSSFWNPKWWLKFAKVRVHMSTSKHINFIEEAQKNK